VRRLKALAKRLLGPAGKSTIAPLVDLPRMKAVNELWLGELDSAKIEYVSANLMYTDVLDGREFDAIWCTGVLSHNPEQLPMIKKLYDLLCPDGVLVLESATIRRSRLRRESCVEIIYPSSERIERKYHLSQNITHLPSARAVAAYFATKPLRVPAGRYYQLGGDEGYVVGKALSVVVRAR